MATINTILKEIKDIPLNRLEEVYQLVHSFTPKSKKASGSTQKILSFGGAFSSLDTKTYNAYLKHIEKTRADLFSRNTEI